MPNAIVKSFAKKSGRSVDEVERLWDRASSIAKKKVGASDIFAYTVGILKKMLKVAKKEGLLADPNIIVEDYLIEGEMEINKQKWRMRQDPKNSSSKIFDRDGSRARREKRDAERRKKQQRAKEKVCNEQLYLNGAGLLELTEKDKESLEDRLKKKYNITKFGPGSIGLDEDKGIYYGWSHRAIFGFKIGDKIFEEEFGDENTHFSKHGSKTIKTLDDAKKAAQAFSDYVS